MRSLFHAATAVSTAGDADAKVTIYELRTGNTSSRSARSGNTAFIATTDTRRFDDSVFSRKGERNEKLKRMWFEPWMSTAPESLHRFGLASEKLSGSSERFVSSTTCFSAGGCLFTSVVDAFLPFYPEAAL